VILTGGTNMLFGIGTTEKMRISSSGNVIDSADTGELKVCPAP